MGTCEKSCRRGCQSYTLSCTAAVLAAEEKVGEKTKANVGNSSLLLQMRNSRTLSAVFTPALVSAQENETWIALQFWICPTRQLSVFLLKEAPHSCSLMVFMHTRAHNPNLGETSRFLVKLTPLLWTEAPQALTPDSCSHIEVCWRSWTPPRPSCGLQLKLLSRPGGQRQKTKGKKVRQTVGSRGDHNYSLSHNRHLTSLQRHTTIPFSNPSSLPLLLSRENVQASREAVQTLTPLISHSQDLGYLFGSDTNVGFSLAIPCETDV